jgi:transketolase
MKAPADINPIVSATAPGSSPEMPERTLVFAPRREFKRVLSANASQVERTALFATLARLNTLSMIAAAGSGHIGSSFSSMDIVSWLFLNEMTLPTKPDRSEERDIFFSSKGHDAPGLYAIKIALGLLPESMLWRLRRHGGLPGHPDTRLTPFIEANTGSLGMGISKAKGIAIANRLAGRSGRIFVMTGDGELQEGQIWESLGSAAARRLAEITVIVDHNKLQSDTYVADTADVGDLAAKFSAFGWNVLRCDGHDFDELAAALAAAREREGPTAIIADTVKGRGVSFMEHSAMQGRWYRYHSGAPAVADYERAVAELTERAEAQCAELGIEAPALLDSAIPAARPTTAPRQFLVKAYGKALLEEARREPSLVALDADLVLDTGLIPFSEEFPDRFIECGIAEQDMVSQASGLALSGLLPVVHSFACFLTARANEQIYNADSEQTRIIYVGSLAGLIPAGPGHSHQSVRDIALMGCLPNTIALEPCCEAEMAMAVTWAVRENAKSTYLRAVSVPVELGFDLPSDYRLELGRGVALTEGDDSVVIAYGPISLREAVTAASVLETKGLGVRVINLPWLNHFDEQWLLDAVSGARRIFTIDNHYIAGGQGERVAAKLAAKGCRAPVTCLGLNELPACGTEQEVLAYHGLDADSLVEVLGR